MKKEITELEDIKNLVNTFYGKVRKDNLIGPIFNDIIQDEWSQHLEKMYRFWQTILLREHTYNGNPFFPHSKLPVEAAHFSRWIEYFTDTVDENFYGEIAEEAKWRASKMAEMFHMRIEEYKQYSKGSIM